MTYYTQDNNNLKKVGTVIKTDRGYVTNPTAEQYASIGAYPRSEESFAPPPTDEEHHAVHDGYALEDGKWVKLWRIEPIVHTVGDYDQAMEDYLRRMREKRGYTAREPDTYLHSSDPRWSQDAKDWVAFKDDVMHYALDVINTYAKTGNAPTLNEFKAGFPKITWTYKEDE
jgi:hypothetical protein